MAVQACSHAVSIAHGVLDFGPRWVAIMWGLCTMRRPHSDAVGVVFVEDRTPSVVQCMASMHGWLVYRTLVCDIGLHSPRLCLYVYMAFLPPSSCPTFVPLGKPLAHTSPSLVCQSPASVTSLYGSSIPFPTSPHMQHVLSYVPLSRP
jgi:hypothetical protein